MATRNVRAPYFQDQTGLRLALYEEPLGTVFVAECDIEQDTPPGNYLGELVDVASGLYIIYIVNSLDQTLSEGILLHTDAEGEERVDDIVAVLAAAYANGVIPPQENPDKISGFVFCFDNDHELTAGVQISGKLIQANQGAGTTWSEKEFTLVSGSDPLGLATRGFLRGAAYDLKRGVGATVRVNVPLLGDSFALDESLGLP